MSARYTEKHTQHDKLILMAWARVTLWILSSAFSQVNLTAITEANTYHRAIDTKPISEMIN